MIAIAGAMPELVANRSSKRRRSLSQDQITHLRREGLQANIGQEERPVIVVDVPQLTQVFLVRVLSASLTHVVPDEVNVRALSPKT